LGVQEGRNPTVVSVSPSVDIVKDFVNADQFAEISPTPRPGLLAVVFAAHPSSRQRNLLRLISFIDLVAIDRSLKYRACRLLRHMTARCGTICTASIES
jgi:hypothetical protein